jgi:hypothetical protein
MIPFFFYFDILLTKNLYKTWNVDTCKEIVLPLVRTGAPTPGSLFTTWLKFKIKWKHHSSCRVLPRISVALQHLKINELLIGEALKAGQIMRGYSWRYFLFGARMWYGVWRSIPVTNQWKTSICWTKPARAGFSRSIFSFLFTFFSQGRWTSFKLKPGLERNKNNRWRKKYLQYSKYLTTVA